MKESENISLDITPPDNRLKCNRCSRTFSNAFHLNQHLRIHLGVKPYRCLICSKRFTQMSHLTQHTRVHTGDRPYICKFATCKKRFSQVTSLLFHSKCHQTDLPYKCNSCYKCFSGENKLKEHIYSHFYSKHLRIYICTECGMSYSEISKLKEHMLKNSCRPKLLNNKKNVNKYIRIPKNNKSNVHNLSLSSSSKSDGVNKTKISPKSQYKIATFPVQSYEGTHINNLNTNPINQAELNYQALCFKYEWGNFKFLNNTFNVNKSETASIIDDVLKTQEMRPSVIKIVKGDVNPFIWTRAEGNSFRDHENSLNIVQTTFKQNITRESIIKKCTL
ncbi:unnamed protein product [Gordionus sp. m RMFG-2023]|uniref:zinc finger protein 765-like n=1 Tax=Gordionus sp. m RMFG-2023 TaxID=3053472 RepID=UPI0030DFEAC4